MTPKVIHYRGEHDYQPQWATDSVGNRIQYGLRCSCGSGRPNNAHRTTGDIPNYGDKRPLWDADERQVVRVNPTPAMSTSDRVAIILLENIGQLVAILLGCFFVFAAGLEWLAPWLDRSNTGLAGLLVLGIGLASLRLRWPEP